MVKESRTNLPDQVEAVGDEKLDKFYDFRRERNMEHMVFLAEWESRLGEVKKVAATTGSPLLDYFGKAYWLFRCGRYGKKARRWTLQPVLGGCTKLPQILQAARTLPDNLSREVYYLQDNDAFLSHSMQDTCSQYGGSTDFSYCGNWDENWAAEG